MTGAIVPLSIGLLIVILAVGMPYWLIHRHMRPQEDAAEVNAYAQATGRTMTEISDRLPGRPLRDDRAARRWRRSAHSGASVTVEQARADRSG